MGLVCHDAVREVLQGELSLVYRNNQINYHFRAGHPVGEAYRAGQPGISKTKRPSSRATRLTAVWWEALES
jgi:hypothetical protein